MNRFHANWKRVQRLYHHFRPTIVVLIYHRVAPLASDPLRLGISSENFAEQMEIVAQAATPISLDDAVQSVVEGRMPHRGVVVTLDDGYRDNLLNAKPILERFGIPATVFVVSGYVGEVEFWWMLLPRLLLSPGQLPPTLELEGPTGRQWELGHARWLDSEVATQHLSWSLADPAPTPRHAFYRSVRDTFLPASAADRRSWAAHLLQWAGSERPRDPAAGPMSASELRELEKGGVVRVGSHTLSHLVLSVHDEATQRAEIVQGKAALEGIVGHSVDSFAYPYGHPGSHYTLRTRNEVVQGGFGCACASPLGPLVRGADLFQIPRAWPGNWKGSEFAEILRSWFLR